MKLSPLLVMFLILPVENQLFVDDDPVDFIEAWNGHFANPVIQIRSFVGIAVNWVSRLIVWVLLGSVWAHIRGDQYDYNLNSTVLFNYGMSDTKAFQNTIKAGSFGIIIILLWNLVASLGSPISVPQELSPIGGRGRRDTQEHDDEGWWPSASVINESPSPRIKDSNINNSIFGENEKYQSNFVEEPSKIPTFLQDVLIPALNQNLEPNGIGRNTLISTVVSLAQVIFWLACSLLLPQI